MEGREATHPSDSKLKYRSDMKRFRRLTDSGGSAQETLDDVCFGERDGISMI
jgi:hypothetical protein